MANSTILLDEFSEAVSAALKSVENAVYEQVDKGLDRAADYMVEKLKAATPVDTGKTKASWKAEYKYRNVRYINNTHTRSGKKNIPVVNLLEFSEKGKPFVRKTVNSEKEKVIGIIKEEIKRGNTQ